jgi:hypothetical protein
MSFFVVASHARGNEEGTKWWQSDRIKREIGLSNEQSRQLEDIFQAALPRMRLEKEELDRQERSLSALMKDVNGGWNDIEQAIDRVEAARSRAGKTRLMMLYRLYRVMTAHSRLSRSP